MDGWLDRGMAIDWGMDGWMDGWGNGRRRGGWMKRCRDGWMGD